MSSSQSNGARLIAGAILAGAGAITFGLGELASDQGAARFIGAFLLVAGLVMLPQVYEKLVAGPAALSRWYVGTYRSQRGSPD